MTENLMRKVVLQTRFKVVLQTCFQAAVRQNCEKKAAMWAKTSSSAHGSLALRTRADSSEDGNTENAYIIWTRHTVAYVLMYGAADCAWQAGKI